MKVHRCASLLLLIAGLAPAPARAWTSSGKWAAHVVGYRVNPTNLDVTSAAALAAIRRGADAWTKQSKAAFRFRYDGSSSATVFGLDGTNLVLFRNEENPDSATARATTYKWLLLGKFLEADIVFWDKPISYVAGAMTCSKQLYVEDVGTHEFGHALGLEHVTVADATMKSGSPYCSKARVSLAADDIAGVEALYPCSSASECDDGLPCTTDSCGSNNKCERTAIAGCCTTNAQCDDGQACTKDSCGSNVCAHAPIAGCCTSDADCDDLDACTEDACTSNACSHAPVVGCCAGECDAGRVDPDGAQPLADAASGPDGQLGPDSTSVANSDAGLTTSETGAADAAGEPMPTAHTGGCALTAGARGGSPSLATLALLALLCGRRRGRPLPYRRRQRG